MAARLFRSEAIRHAEKLDISTCAQVKKDILYQKAHTAFADQQGTRAYYPLIQPYLGGAPVEELKKLARSHVAMDIDTFINLNPEEVKKFDVQDVKDLLGVNLPDLKEVENHPSVAMWIKNKFQSELDSLGIGLVGGRASLFSTSMGSTVSSISLSTKSDNVLTATSPVILSMESTLSSPGHINITTPSISSATSDLNPFVSRDATESYSTPVFKITLLTNEISPSINNTQTTLSDRMPKYAFPTNISDSDNTMAGTRVPTDARNTPVPTEITIDSNSDTTNQTDFPISGIPASFIARGINMTTSNEHIINSSNAKANSSAASSIPTKSSVSVPTEMVIPFWNITTTLNETGGTPVPTISTIVTDFNSNPASRRILPSASTDSATVLPTTSLNATAVSDGTLFHSTARYFNTTIFSKLLTDSNNSTVSAPVVTTTPLDPTTVVTSKTRAISYNVSVTSNDTIKDTLFHYNATSSNVIPSAETTGASDSNTTNNGTAFPSPVTDGHVTAGLNVTIFHSPTVVTNFTVGADTTTARTYFTSVMSSMTRTSSEQLSTSPKHTLATNPALFSKKTITITDKQPTASSKMTFHSQETSTKTAIPPLSSPNRTTSQAAATIQRSSRAAPPTKPPSHPTPNGYIHVKPLSASALNTSLSWILLALSLTVGTSIQKFL
ncbi:mucin-5AC-like [Thamnophis elegans]|uniref:mucin-5AC-like n=1 Tax=Thamnophis elegans TaxID=35005 RepID=UPI001378A797|nr:mucin-5AC-like [Thamnophis elegans]